MYGITGTPGTGKTSVAGTLQKRGYGVIHQIDTVGPYILEKDSERETLVIDEERWAEEFIPAEGFIEGHLVHLLPCDAIIILRCRPDVLGERLSARNYPPEKIRENMEAEALDVILIETLELIDPRQVYELDTTDKSVRECCDMIERFVRGETPGSYGKIDWSMYLGREP